MTTHFATIAVLSALASGQAFAGDPTLNCGSPSSSYTVLISRSQKTATISSKTSKGVLATLRCKEFRHSKPYMSCFDSGKETQGTYAVEVHKTDAPMISIVELFELDEIGTATRLAELTCEHEF